MKYLVVIGLLMIGIQIDASQLKSGKKPKPISSSYSVPGEALRAWQNAGRTSMEQSIDELRGNFDTESYQQLVGKLEEENKLLQDIRKSVGKKIRKKKTLKSGLEKMSQDLANFREQLESIALVVQWGREIEGIAAVFSAGEKANATKVSYQAWSKILEESLEKLNSKKALLPDDKFKEFKIKLEVFKAKIKRSFERRGFKDKEKTTATPQPEPLIQEDTRALVDVQPTTSRTTQEPQATTSFDSSAAPTTTQTPPREQQSEQIKPAEIQQSTLERVSIPTVSAGNPVVSITAKPKYNWKALFGIGAGVVTVAATVIWYLWSPKNIIISHS